MATPTYTGRADGVTGVLHGSVTGDGTAVVLSLGFNPAYALVLNETDAMRWEKIASQAAANAMKTVTAGTLTTDTSSAILFNGDGTVTLSAALAASGKAIKFYFRR